MAKVIYCQKLRVAKVKCEILEWHKQSWQKLEWQKQSFPYADMASEHRDRKVERESYSRYDQHSDAHH